MLAREVILNAPEACIRLCDARFDERSVLSSILWYLVSCLLCWHVHKRVTFVYEHFGAVYTGIQPLCVALLFVPLLVDMLFVNVVEGA